MGLMASIVFNSLGDAVDISRREETIMEMDRLAYAVTGNPDRISGGRRTNYGYFGDVGSLPPSWDALLANPGGYLTWNGPYLYDVYASGTGEYEFRLDGWGNHYSSPSNLNFSSTGGGATITRQFAHSLGQLLHNRVTAVIVDIDNNPPGIVHRDSVRLELIIPDGAGGYRTISKYPGHDGFVRYDSIPIGIHRLQTIYIPMNDTLERCINVDPGSNLHIDIQYYSDVW
jgi:hypothetical protein